MRVGLALAFACAMQAQVVVISHRGEHLRHRENTMAAFDAAYEAKADYIEVDIRTTSDGKLVLMHDSTAERTLGLKEEIAKLPFERLRSLGVPSFDEALAFAKTRLGIYIDCKQAKAEDLVALVRANHMEESVLVYCGLKLCKEIQQLEPKMTLMPEARDAATARSLIAELGLTALAFDANDFKDDVIAVAKQARVRIYVDRLGTADNPAGWQDAIDRGAAGIQTDHPAELANYLTHHRATFDAAVVKAIPDSVGWPPRAGYYVPPTMVDPKRFRAKTVLLPIIEWAYGLRDFQISGGPAWLKNGRFEIEATTEEASTDAQLRQMLQVLLADRFQLKFHRESKELSVYWLVVDKNGPKLSPTKEGSSYEGRGNFEVGNGIVVARGGTIAGFCEVLTDNLQRPVIDKTALSGRYDFKLAFEPPPPAPVWTPFGQEIFTPIRDLGLRIESHKSQVEMLVIDSVERPSGN